MLHGMDQTQLIEELDEVRESGLCNMLDRHCVLSAARQLELDYLVSFMELDMLWDYVQLFSAYTSAKEASVA